MVVEHHVLHHARLVVTASYPEDVAIDSVIEGSGRDLDLFLRLSDVVPEGEYLVVGDRDEVVDDEECADADEEGGDEDRAHHPEDGHAGGLQSDQLVVLTHVAYGHHRGQQGRQRQGQRQHGAGSPEQELRHNAQTQAFPDKLVDVDPEELHHEDEDDHKKDHEEWSYE